MGFQLWFKTELSGPSARWTWLLPDVYTYSSNETAGPGWILQGLDVIALFQALKLATVIGSY